MAIRYGVFGDARDYWCGDWLQGDAPIHSHTNCLCNPDSMAITSVPTPKTGNLLEVKRIIFHDPATIVFWADGTKTVVKCMEGTLFNPYYGFLCALGKKVYGSNSAINRIIREHTD